MSNHIGVGWQCHLVVKFKNDSTAVAGEPVFWFDGNTADGPDHAHLAKTAVSDV
ncbi:hypothetical protein [Candidatus Aalborgicola defluviihabitans]|uniref:hypothetical protein n=1 Tax=Candidatus Aalborgicola defluviihabitans TaxID=3386187 RepID=UPI0039B8FC29